MSSMNLPVTSIGTLKVSLLFALGYVTVYTTDLVGDANLERYVSLGVGGILAGTIFYFYRQQSSLMAKRERETGEAYRLQSVQLIATLQETSKVNTQVLAAVTELRTQLSEMAH